MRCGTEADVGATAPVRRVVFRSKAIARGVRDLVELVVLCCQSSVGGQILFGVALVVRCSCGTSRYPTIQRCAGLDGQAIQREVRGSEREGHIEIALPVAMQFVGKREDQVQRNVFDAGAAQYRKSTRLNSSHLVIS